MEQEEEKIIALLKDEKLEEGVPLVMAYYGIHVTDDKVEVATNSHLGQLDLERICWIYDNIAAYFQLYGPRQYAFVLFREIFRMAKGLSLKWHYYSKYLFSAHHLDIPCEEYFRIHVAYNKLFKDIWQFKHDKDLHRKHKKIRIGYLSSDFRRHVVLLFSWVLWSKYNRDEFQVYCFSDGDEDDYTKEIQKRVDYWVDIGGMKASEAAKQICFYGIDILFELGGHAHDNLPILAYKPAPVQICGIGYFATTGLKTVDYFLTDKYLMAGGGGKYFVEKPLVVPHSHFCFTPLNDMPKEVKGAPCLEKGYITFGSLNDPLKINKNVLATWGKIMAQVPGARLFIKGRTLDTVKGVENIRQRMQEAGIDIERVDMEPYTLPYLEAYWKIDIALDTFPYPGGGTTCDALCMSCPVITLGDGTQGGDFGISLLKNTGLPELCTYSQEEYIQKAVELANDKERLEYLHRNLKRMFMESPVCDGAGYMRDLEDNYRRIWKEYMDSNDGSMKDMEPIKLVHKADANVKDVTPYYEELISDLEPVMTKRILVCSSDNMLSMLVRQTYSWAIVETIQDVGRDRLLQDYDVVEIQHYDWGLLDGTMDEFKDNARMIQAVGLHLSPGGQMKCIAMSQMELREVYVAFYENGFKNMYQQDIGYIQAGVDDVYIYYAGGFSTVQMWLKQYFTEDIRRKIGFLMSRIDFDIDAEESAVKLKALCQEQNIKPNYINTFVESATINKEKVLVLLGM